MKRLFLHIIPFIISSILMVSCYDDTFVEGQSLGEEETGIDLTLSIPVDNGATRGLVSTPAEQAKLIEEAECKINDIYALAFNREGMFLGLFKETQYQISGRLTATISIEKTGENNPITVMVLTNLSTLDNGSSLVSAIRNSESNWIGKSKTEVLNSLKYEFSKAWNLADTYIPMWGEIEITPVAGQTSNGTVNMYRAISKINVTVNEGRGLQEAVTGTDIFRLTSVHVFYARTSGLVGSLVPPTNTNYGYAIPTPSLPYRVAYFTKENKLEFNADKGINYAIESKIYVPESKQQVKDEEPMCLVVGGYYMEEDKESFYRIDFKEGNKSESEFYDAVRNWNYNFNIKSVSHSGTDTPEEALDVTVGIEVTITPWTTEYMRGIGGQYDLKVSAGGFVLDALNTASNELTIETTYQDGWKIEGQSGNWFTITKMNDKAGIYITPNNENIGGQRKGKFFVVAGNVKKEITIVQKGKETANCYIAPGGVDRNGNNIDYIYDLIVTVKGNGEAGLIADGYPFGDPSASSAYLETSYAMIIWETSPGLVTLKDADSNKKAKANENGIVQYKVNATLVNDNIKSYYNSFNNYHNSSNPLRGGNALIGAFNENNQLIWSWHIWVCPDMDMNSQDGYFDPETDINDGLKMYGYREELWSSGYKFMDRNLGALSSNPGLGSLGLLYQWGRKDPFIGPGAISSSPQKMKTTHYLCNGRVYDWGDSGYSQYTIAQSILNPTTLIDGTIQSSDYSHLWGTDAGISGEKEAGNKTIYDPCPAGYRVPPVASIIFEGGGISSLTRNYDYNNNYQAIHTYDAYAYGFNMYRLSDYYGNWSSLKLTNFYEARPDWHVWLPISGAYSSTMDKFTTELEGKSSVINNSILWTNSSIDIQDGKETITKPAGLFLHGTTNHFHALKTTGNLSAQPQYAGSVRCIRDEAGSNTIKMPENIILAKAKGSTKTGTLVSIAYGWEVVNPGAVWFKVTPDEGSSGSKQILTFTATQENTTPISRSANLRIRFKDGSEREMTVTQEGDPTKLTQVSGNNQTINRGDYGITKAKQIATISNSTNRAWTISLSDNTNWGILVDGTAINTPYAGSGNTTIKVYPKSANGTGAIRYVTVTIAPADGSGYTYEYQASQKR